MGDHNGCTPLMFTVANGDIEVAQVMLEARSNINAKDFEGHTPLDYASHFGHAELMRIIRDLGGEGMEEDDGEEEDDGGEEEAVEAAEEAAAPAEEEAAAAEPEVAEAGDGEKGEKKGKKKSGKDGEKKKADDKAE